MSEGWFGKEEQATFDLQAAARLGAGAECHVCEVPAAHLVELSQDGEPIELGSAVFLCQVCFDLVSGRDMEALALRFTEVSASEAAQLADRMISGNVGSAPVAP